MARRLPATLAGGRIRTSTVVLVLAFFALLTLYLLVRPLPEGVSMPSTSSRSSTAPERSGSPSSDVAPEPSETSAEPTPDETPSVETTEDPTGPAPTDAPLAPSSAPVPTDPGSGGATSPNSEPAPAPEPAGTS